jgi:ankyrin repeat protein
MGSGGSVLQDQLIGDAGIAKVKQKFGKVENNAGDQYKVQSALVQKKVKSLDGFVDAYGNTVLHHCAMKNEPDRALSIIAAGGLLDVRNDDERTPLHMAALKGVVPMIEVLAEARADLRAKDIDGRTPLHLATVHGYEESCKMLLRQAVADGKAEGIDDENAQVDRVADLVNIADNMGRTCALWAVYSGYMKEKQQEQLELELKLREQQVKSRQVFYNFCMMASGNQLYPCWGAWRQYVVITKRERNQEHAEQEISRLLHVAGDMVKFMGGSRGHKGPLSHADLSGGTVLHFTLLRHADHRAKLWKLFLPTSDTYDPGVFIRDGPRGPLLHHCAEVGDEHLMRFIVAALPKEKLGHIDSQGNTALHVAVSNVQIGTTQVLVTAGAPTDYQDAENRTPGDIAATKGSKELAKLVAYKASINDMAGAGRTAEVEKMIAQGGDPNRRDREGRTPLMAACLCKHELTVGTLVDHKCDVNARDKSGFDALTWLLDPKKGEDPATLKILRTLINGGLDVRRVVQAGPRVGSTSLILAASSGFAKVVAQLCAASGDVEHKEPSGKNALMYAVAKEHPDVVRVLCDARADPLAEDARGFTPVAMALQSDVLELREILHGEHSKRR